MGNALKGFSGGAVGMRQRPYTPQETEFSLTDWNTWNLQGAGNLAGNLIGGAGPPLAAGLAGLVSGEPRFRPLALVGGGLGYAGERSRQDLVDREKAALRTALEKPGGVYAKYYQQQLPSVQQRSPASGEMAKLAQAGINAVSYPLGGAVIHGWASPLRRRWLGRRC